MKNKIILVLSGLIAVNTVLGNIGGEEDVFETKEDVFGSNEAQLVHQETTTVNMEVIEKPIVTITNDGLKVQEICVDYKLYERCVHEIKKGMDQYIITYYINKDFLLDCLEKFKPLHTDKAKKLGKKPIVFKQLNVYNPCDIPTEETDEFSIEGFQVDKSCYNLSDFEAFYNPLSKFDKPIVFTVFEALKDEIEKRYNLNNCKIYYFNHLTSFDDYLKVAKLDIENLSFGTIRVAFKPFSEEQMLKEKFKLALKYLKGESIEELKKGVELLLGLNLKQEFRKDLGLHKLSKAVSNEEFIEILREQKYKIRTRIEELIEKIEEIEQEKDLITEEKELRKQLHAYVHDNRVKKIEIFEVAYTNNYTEGSLSIPIEYATSLKLGFNGGITETQLINPKNAEAILFVPEKIVKMENVTCDTLFCRELKGDIGKNVSCKTIICQDLRKDVKYFIN